MLFIFFIINILLTTNTTVINNLSVYLLNEHLLIGSLTINCITLVTICLVIAGITKSAQLVFNV